MRLKNTKLLLWIPLALALLCWPHSTVRAEELNMKNHSQFIDPAGFVLIDGKPRLILGMYGTHSDEQLQQLAENGYNLIAQVWPPTTEALDRIQKYGLYGCVNFPYDPRVKDPADESPPPEQCEPLVNVINEVKDHPALLGWELRDEVIAHSVWYDSGWKRNDEMAELERLIEAQAQADPELAEVRLERLRKGKKLMGRGLASDGEALWDALWTELGEEGPNPRLRTSYGWKRSDRATEGLGRLCEYVREQDGKHLIWTNHAALNSIARLSKLNAFADAAGNDHYPITGVHTPSTDDHPEEIGWFTKRMRAAAPGKSCWMVIQGFGWRDLDWTGVGYQIGEGWSANPDPDLGRRPNLRETRFMAYDAIVHGANALLYYGSDFIEGGPHVGGYGKGEPLGDRDVPQIWTDMMTIGRELRALEPAILGQAPSKEPTSAAEETMGPLDGQGPALMLRKTGEDWVLIVANETKWTGAFTVSDLPAELEGAALYRLNSGDSVTVSDGGFRDGIYGYGVNVYATSRRFEATETGNP